MNVNPSRLQSHASLRLNVCSSSAIVPLAAGFMCPVLCTPCVFDLTRVGFHGVLRVLLLICPCRSFSYDTIAVYIVHKQDLTVWDNIILILIRRCLEITSLLYYFKYAPEAFLSERLLRRELRNFCKRVLLLCNIGIFGKK